MFSGVDAELIAQPVEAAAERQEYAVADLEVLVEILGLLEHLELDAVAAMEFELHRRHPDVAVDHVVAQIGIDLRVSAELNAANPAVILEARRPVELRTPRAEIAPGRKTDCRVVCRLHFLELHLRPIRIARDAQVPAIRITVPAGRRFAVLVEEV